MVGISLPYSPGITAVILYYVIEENNKNKHNENTRDLHKKAKQYETIRTYEINS